MAKSNDPMKRETQRKDISKSLKKLREIQEEPSPIEPIALDEKRRKRKKKTH